MSRRGQLRTTASGRGAFPAVLVMALGAFVAVREGHAHGAVSMEADQCKLKVDSYFMHFTGYQPQSSRAEFCEDIPEVGRTIIVLDFVDESLRDIPVSVNLARDDGVQRMEMTDTSSSILYIPPRKYPNGTIKIEVNFEKAGRYVGVVAIEGRGQSVANFPFDVGRSWSLIRLLAWCLVIVSGAVGTFLWARRRYSIGRELSSANHRQRRVDSMKRFVLVLMAVLIGMPSAVLAHAHLIRSTPQDGSEISAPIDPIVLYFTEALEQRLINVALSRDNKSVSGLSQPVLSGNGRIVNVSLPHLFAGLYTVSWSVVSIDGHRTEGKFKFLYREP